MMVTERYCGKLEENVVYAPLTAKEQVAFVHGKWTQAGKRVSTYVLRNGIRICFLVPTRQL